VADAAASATLVCLRRHADFASFVKSANVRTGGVLRLRVRITSIEDGGALSRR
jgi:hypothetical protein